MFRNIDISINKILHNDLLYYEKSGYGRKHIQEWPFYNFIKMWINGDCEYARNQWIAWLVEEFKKYCHFAKSKGGMYQGSVHRNAIKNIDHNKNKFWVEPSLIDDINITHGATLLVDERINLINSIINSGYKLELASPIFAVKKKGFYILKGGHHRAAIMYALGHEVLNGVTKYSTILWKLRIWIFKIKKFIS